MENNIIKLSIFIFFKRYLESNFNDRISLLSPFKTAKNYKLVTIKIGDSERNLN